MMNINSKKHRKLTLLYFLCSTLLCLAEEETTPIFSKQDPYPLTYRPDENKKKQLQDDLLYYCEDRRLTEQDSKCLYIQAILAITKEDLVAAKQALIMSIQADPSFAAPRLQLAYVYLWLKEMDEALTAFEEFNTLYPCNPGTFAGLEKIADYFSDNKNRVDQSICIYSNLLACDAKNRAELLYKLGSTQAFAGYYVKAEQSLLEALSVDPKNSDAAIALGYLYLWQNKLSQAKTIFLQWDNLADAQQGLGAIEMRENNYKQAICWYQKAKEQTRILPTESSQNLARALSFELKYTDAKDQYQEILERDRKNGSVNRELLDVRLHTNPAFILNTNWTQVQETDPSIRKPVVRDYYYSGDGTFLIPVFDRLRIDLQGYYGTQKEQNILSPVGNLNYNAAISSMSITPRLFFAPDWSWNSFIRIRKAWKLGSMLYPFQKTTEFQPGSYVVYNGPNHLFATGAYVDSFLIKNFSTITSYLLETNTVDLLYRYRFSVACQPEIEGSAEKLFIKDHLHNHRTSETIWFRFGIPGIEDNATLMYGFEHKHYARLNINYYSFKQQWRDSFGLKLHGYWTDKTYVELSYQWKWQKTKDLYQPIGNFVFIAPLQILTVNVVQGLIQLQTSDFLKTEIGGYYYVDTQPIRTWSVYGNILWSF